MTELIKPPSPAATGPEQLNPPSPIKYIGLDIAGRPAASLAGAMDKLLESLGIDPHKFPPAQEDKVGKPAVSQAGAETQLTGAKIDDKKMPECSGAIAGVIKRIDKSQTSVLQASSKDSSWSSGSQYPEWENWHRWDKR